MFSMERQWIPKDKIAEFDLLVIKQSRCNMEQLNCELRRQNKKIFLNRAIAPASNGFTCKFQKFVQLPARQKLPNYTIKSGANTEVKNLAFIKKMLEVLLKYGKNAEMRLRTFT